MPVECLCTYMYNNIMITFMLLIMCQVYGVKGPSWLDILKEFDRHCCGLHALCAAWSVQVTPAFVA